MIRILRAGVRDGVHAQERSHRPLNSLPPTPPLLPSYCATHARPLLPAALASVSFGFVLVRVRVQFCDIVSEGIDLGGVASGTGLTGATDDRFETCQWGSELALNGDLELEVGEAQPAAGRVGKEGVAERALAALLKRELALVVRSEGRCPDAQGFGLEDANLFKGPTDKKREI